MTEAMTEMNRPASRKARIGAGAAGVLLAATLQFPSTQLARADDSQPGFVMTVIADRARGDQVMSGDYVAAIAGITSPKARHWDSFAVSNNLCVAYTKLNDLASADQACADALLTSRETPGEWNGSQRKRGDRAVALSNRGVIRAVSGDAEGARSDFERARELNEGLAAAAQNLARLDRDTAQAVSSL